MALYKYVYDCDYDVVPAGTVPETVPVRSLLIIINYWCQQPQYSINSTLNRCRY